MITKFIIGFACELNLKNRPENSSRLVKFLNIIFVQNKSQPLSRLKSMENTKAINQKNSLECVYTKQVCTIGKSVYITLT